MLFTKNKWNTVNGIWIKSQVTDMFDEGKSKQEIVDFFYNTGNNGHFLWGTSSKESIEKSVDEIEEIYNKTNRFSFPKFFEKMNKHYFDNDKVVR
jgi:hypothetical protein